MSIARTLLFNVLYVCIAVTSFEVGMRKAQSGIPLKLDDLVNPGYQEKWATLGRAAILKQHHLPPGTSLEKAGLFQDQLELNTNWFIVPGGIGFRYSPDEITPYCLGEVEFILPWKDIIDQLRPDARVYQIARSFVPKR